MRPLTTTLVVPETISTILKNIAAEPLETAGVLLSSLVGDARSNWRLLAREYHPVPNDAYLSRREDSLAIASHGYVPALGRAEHIGAFALWVHTHPGTNSVPRPSEHDLVVDELLLEPFLLRTGGPWYGALIVSPSTNGIQFTGHVSHSDGEIREIRHLWSVGDRFALTDAYGQPKRSVLASYDRNVRAFGPAVQSTIGSITIGVVGCGGTGSAVIEQLVRLGVRSFVLIDPERLEQSNLTRVYGSTAGDLGMPKVEIQARHIHAIAPDAQCVVLKKMITDQSAARVLSQCDVIFGCTDDNAGRLILSRIPTYLLTPVIDCGVLLSSGDGGALQGIDGRITTLVPEHACLHCRGRVDVRRAAAELMTPEERVRLAAEGYAPALEGVQPAVVTFTSAVAALAVSELLERLIGYGPIPRPSEMLVRFHEREISTNIALSRPRHYCNPSSEKIGAGITQPFLDLLWKS